MSSLLTFPPIDGDPWIGLVAAALLAPVAYTEPDPVWVWYRSSEGCPDGAAFIARLAELGQAARLARWGIASTSW
ncbi:MAG TPA: hypothetical protein VFS67_25125 [Polyangiaceae bacterium]|nr:hypothetical protein [Polyangiaceae bacterium]